MNTKSKLTSKKLDEIYDFCKKAEGWEAIGKFQNSNDLLLVSELGKIGSDFTEKQKKQLRQLEFQK
jgi:hypothetical protein